MKRVLSEALYLAFLALSKSLKVKLLKPNFNDQGELVLDCRTIDT